MRPLREGAAWLGALGAGLVAFGWWGTETHAGRHRYDEMAGMIPFFAGLAGFALVAIAFTLLLFSTRKTPDAPRR